MPKKKRSPCVVTEKVLFARPRFRVLRVHKTPGLYHAWTSYHLQAKLPNQTWVTLEQYDYYRNATNRALGCHLVVDNHGFVMEIQNMKGKGPKVKTKTPNP